MNPKDAEFPETTQATKGVTLFKKIFNIKVLNKVIKLAFFIVICLFVVAECLLSASSKREHWTSRDIGWW